MFVTLRRHPANCSVDHLVGAQQDDSGIASPSALRPLRHSLLTFAALMIGVQRAISLFTSAAGGCWPRLALGGMSPPMSSRRLSSICNSENNHGVVGLITGAKSKGGLDGC
jgi:hypothetical protein